MGSFQKSTILRVSCRSIIVTFFFVLLAVEHDKKKHRYFTRTDTTKTNPNAHTSGYPRSRYDASTKPCVSNSHTAVRPLLLKSPQITTGVEVPVGGGEVPPPPLPPPPFPPPFACFPFVLLPFEGAADAAADDASADSSRAASFRAASRPSKTCRIRRSGAGPPVKWQFTTIISRCCWRPRRISLGPPSSSPLPLPPSNAHFWSFCAAPAGLVPPPCCFFVVLLMTASSGSQSLLLPPPFVPPSSVRSSTAFGGGGGEGDGNGGDGVCDVICCCCGGRGSGDSSCVSGATTDGSTVRRPVTSTRSLCFSHASSSFEALKNVADRNRNLACKTHLYLLARVFICVSLKLFLLHRADILETTSTAAWSVGMQRAFV